MDLRNQGLQWNIFNINISDIYLQVPGCGPAKQQAGLLLTKTLRSGSHHPTGESNLKQNIFVWQFILRFPLKLRMFVYETRVVNLESTTVTGINLLIFRWY